MKALFDVVKGFLMAIADSVPGVSGGTIAYLLGFFDKFIYSLNYLLKGTRAERVSALKFLAKLGIGWVMGIALSISLLASLFEEHIYGISSLFLGFIIAAMPMMLREESEHLKGKPKNIVWGMIGMLAVVILSSIRVGSGIDVASLNLGMICYVFVAGALAISAMVLPGISGSTLLLGLGLYLPIITGARDLLHGDFTSFWLLAVFGAGVVVGMLSTLRGVKKLLEHNRGAMVYAILGMMVGSLYAIIIGPTTLKDPQAALSLSTFSPWLFAIGILIVVGLQKLKLRDETEEQSS